MTTQQTHTPGPWEAGHYRGTPTVFWGRGNKTVPIATCHDVASEGDPDANARLIASAPELLETLKETLRSLEEHLDGDTLHANLKHRDLLCPCNQNEVVRAKAAIAKAERRQ